MEAVGGRFPFVAAGRLLYLGASTSKIHHDTKIQITDHLY
jgi:hypothetical protein